MKRTILALILFSLSTATATASASSSDEDFVLYLSFQVGSGYAEFSNSTEGKFANKTPYSLAKYGYDNKLSNSTGNVKFIVGFAGKDKYPVRIEFMSHLDGYGSNAYDRDVSDTVKRKLSMDLEIYSTNLYYDFINQSVFTPFLFITGGVATTKLKIVDTNNTSGKETVQADEKSKQGFFGGGFGFAINLSKNFKIDTTLGYTQNIAYFLENSRKENKGNYYWNEFGMVDLSVGLRYHFNWF